jgi:hypothetical protein
MKKFKTLCALLAVCIAALPSAMQAQVQSSSGLKLVATGPLKMVFQDASLVNHGQFIAGNSTVIFKSSSPTLIGGSSPVSFHNIVVDGQELSLDNDMLVSGSLRLEKGNLQLNNHSIDLGYTGRIDGERNEARITGSNGFIKAKAILNAPAAVNPGNIGVEISSTAALGETEIIRGHSVQLDGTQRYYDIRPQYNTNLRASLKFYYLDAEMNDGKEDALSVYTSKGSGWTEAGKDKNDINTNWVVKNELSQLHRFTLAGAANKVLAGKTSVQLFPNPTPGQFTVMLNSAEEKEAALNLYDQLGRLLESKRINCRIGVNNVAFNIARYANGTYYLSFTNLDLKTVKIVKQ